MVGDLRGLAQAAWENKTCMPPLELARKALANDVLHDRPMRPDFGGSFKPFLGTGARLAIVYFHRKISMRLFSNVQAVQCHMITVYPVLHKSIANRHRRGECRSPICR